MRAALAGVVAVLALTVAACSANRAAPAPEPERATTTTTTTTTTSAPVTTATAAPADDTTRSTAHASCPVEMAAQNAESLVGQSLPVTRTIVTHYYPVHGSSASDLRRQMDQCGPIADGRGNDAYTKWLVNWQTSEQEADGCAIGRVAVHVRVDMYLPQWTDVSTPALEHAWNAYIVALTAHENGHESHGFDAAEQVYRALTHLAPSPTCAELDNATSAAADFVLGSFRTLDVTYDEKTDHGATQGAIFP